jgi:hypothetical protein
VHDPFEYFDNLKWLDNQARLFQDLALHALVQRLAGFYNAARKRPVALQRFLAALDQQNAVPI